jgi:hypothetical protein
MELPRLLQGLMRYITQTFEHVLRNVLAFAVILYKRLVRNWFETGSWSQALFKVEKHKLYTLKLNICY